MRYPDFFSEKRAGQLCLWLGRMDDTGVSLLNYQGSHTSHLGVRPGYGTSNWRAWGLEVVTRSLSGLFSGGLTGPLTCVMQVSLTKVDLGGMSYPVGASVVADWS